MAKGETKNHEGAKDELRKLAIWRKAMEKKRRHHEYRNIEIMQNGKSVFSFTFTLPLLHRFPRHSMARGQGKKEKKKRFTEKMGESKRAK